MPPVCTARLVKQKSESVSVASKSMKVDVYAGATARRSETCRWDSCHMY